jgi:hypothetical protein
MNWTDIVAEVTPYIVKIETPLGHGTGFLCLYNQTKSFCGIATAAHVVSYADEWQQPIRIQHYPSKGTVLLKEENRVIFVDHDTDSAVIVLGVGILDFPESAIPLLPSGTPIGIGVEVGWLGYPALEANTLCFFSGNISARREARNAYLIDGVAINGVSGGPVIYSDATDTVQIVGEVSAYRANRATGEALPGLLVAQDLSHFHSVIKYIKSVDEANQKKEEAKLTAQQSPTLQPAIVPSQEPIEQESPASIPETTIEPEARAATAAESE